MPTAAASKFDDLELEHLGGVAARRQLALVGIGADDVAAQVAARRWQIDGSAVVLHNGSPTREQRWEIGRINCGPRAVLTSFTAAEVRGLKGWQRDETHVLAPAGVARPPVRGLVLHRTGDWSRARLSASGRMHQLAPAVLLAAGSFASPRSACGIVAAAVQQRLLLPRELGVAIGESPRLRHRAVLAAALGDIAQGADSLAEIDFGTLCRRYHLPIPTRQAIRIEPDGRRRYLDVEWRLPDGRVRAAEIDGAFHLRPDRWITDTMRQNEVVIGGTPVLRFPSIMVRLEPARIADQLARFLR